MSSDDFQAHNNAGDAPLMVRGVSLRQVARTLHGLSSRVIKIEERRDTGIHMLVYRIDVAGQRRSFCITVSAEPLESIADLYPEAAAWEQALQQRGSVRFVSAHHQGAD